MKKYNTIIFDLDGTLAVTKSPLTDEMGQLVAQLTQKINVVIITGGRFEQIKKQVIDRLGENVVRSNFYVLPTTGSSMVAYDSKTKEWNYVYRHELTNEQKERIINGIKQALEQASFSINPDDVFENQFEDRGSQITFSALGQYQKPEIKIVWDPEQKKRQELLSYMNHLEDEFALNLGGSTSIDVTLKGIDKEYGINEFYKTTALQIKDGLFVGDKIFPGGNDYPAIKTGIDYRETSGPEETMEIIHEVLQSYD